jgi:hypothetical protein
LIDSAFGREIQLGIFSSLKLAEKGSATYSKLSFRVSEKTGCHLDARHLPGNRNGFRHVGGGAGSR